MARAKKEICSSKFPRPQLFVIFIAMIILLCGALTGCVPKGYSKAAAPIVRDTGDKVKPDNAVAFSISQQFPDLNPYTAPYRDNFLYSDELFYIDKEATYPETRDIYYKWHWFYSVYNADNEFIGTLISDIIEGALSQEIIISFLDGQYIYYLCRADCYVKRFRPSTERFYENIFYEKYAFYRFNLTTYENEEITLDLLFEKLVDIIPYDIKINPNYKINK